MGIPLCFLRASGVQQLHNCEMAYALRYACGIQSAAGPAALKGTTVHKVMEFLARCKMEMQRREEDVAAGRLIVDGGYHVHDVLKDKNDPSKNVELEWNLAENGDIWKINVHRITDDCFDHYLWHRKTTKKERQEVHDWIEKLLNGEPKSFDPRNMNILFAEEKFDLELPYDWATYDFSYRGVRYRGQMRLKGTIDLCVEPSPGLVEGIDWKTGRRMNFHTNAEKGFAEMEDDVQKAIYSYVLRQMFPEKDVAFFTFVYPNDGGAFSIPCSDEDDEKTIQMLREAATTCRTMMFPKRNFSDFCYKFCHFGKTRIQPGEPGFEVDPSKGDQGYTICRTAGNLLTQGYSIDDVIFMLGDPKFEIAHYVDPGSV